MRRFVMLGASHDFPTRVKDLGFRVLSIYGLGFWVESLGFIGLNVYGLRVAMV